MTELLIELSPEIYARLNKEASALGISPERLAQEWLLSRLGTGEQPLAKRQSLSQILAQAGLLSELGPELKKRADQSTASLEEVKEWLTPGKSLSQIFIEQRTQDMVLL